MRALTAIAALILLLYNPLYLIAAVAACVVLGYLWAVVRGFPVAHREMKAHKAYYKAQNTQ